MCVCVCVCVLVVFWCKYIGRKVSDLDKRLLQIILPTHCLKFQGASHKVIIGKVIDSSYMIKWYQPLDIEITEKYWRQNKSYYNILIYLKRIHHVSVG